MVIMMMDVIHDYTASKITSTTVTTATAKTTVATTTTSYNTTTTTTTIRCNMTYSIYNKRVFLSYCQFYYQFIHYSGYDYDDDDGFD